MKIKEKDDVANLPITNISPNKYLLNSPLNKFKTKL